MTATEHATLIAFGIFCFLVLGSIIIFGDRDDHEC